MNKQGTPNFLKAIGTTALSLALVSAAFVGANTLAFASGTQPEVVAADALAVSVPQPVPLPQPAAMTNNTVPQPIPVPQPVAPQQEYKAPTLNVIWNQDLDDNGNPDSRSVPTADAIYYEEAAKIGAEYIFDMTGESIDGKTVQMTFSAQPFSSRTYWVGEVSDSAEDLIIPELTDEELAKLTAEAEEGATMVATGFVNKVQYQFWVDAVTGDRVSIMDWTVDIPHLTESDFGEGRTVTMTPVEFENMRYTETEEAAPFKEIAREYAQKHFNHSKVVSVEFESIDVMAKDGQYQEAYNAGKNTPYPFTIYDKGRFINFNATDDTGRTALVNIYMDAAQVFRFETQDSDFIPGYSADAPGAIG